MSKPLSLYILFYVGFVSCILAGNKQTSSPDFSNVSQLDALFAKLLKLEKEQNGKVNIVHIGDSHIQADMMTNDIRQALQQKFGNGGYGVTFPYTLAKTNGSRTIRYESDANWLNLKNIYPTSSVAVGLSGIALYTNSNKFKIELNAEKKYAFNTIKLLYPTIYPSFNIINNNKQTAPEQAVSEPVRYSAQVQQDKTVKTRMIAHRVTAGETLYRISRNYNVNIEEIKRVNNLKLNSIQTGRLLNIPQDTIIINEALPMVADKVAKVVETKSPPSVFQPHISTYTYDNPQTTVTIIPNNKQTTYNLSGIVLENNKPGLIYHTIGVNGSRTYDFNKYPLFFSQLTALTPDLVVVSFGTNESFGKMTPARYIAQVNKLIDNIRKENKEVPIIICTPPPSFFKRKIPNTLVADYASELLKLDNCIVWDLYSKMKASVGVSIYSPISDILAKDKIHYTKDGYEKQAFLFSSDLLKAYNLYKNNR